MHSTEEATNPLGPDYWDWVAVALFLLITVDLLTTLYAVKTLGLGAESNPVMAWLLVQPLGFVVAVNLLAVVLATVFFYGIYETVTWTPEPYDRYYAVWVELWLGGLIAVGLFVFANNLSAIVLGSSLL
jgi:hypothetical protein